MIIVTNSNILGKNIRFMREKRGMTCEELAERIGWDAYELQDTEACMFRDIDDKVLRNLCRFFDVEMDDVLTKEIME